MAKGTLTVTYNNTSVYGEGTNFTSEVKAGDYIVFSAGEVTYTLVIDSVESDAALKLQKRYTGPSAEGIGWNPVARGTMNQITMEVVTQVTEALRGLNLDKSNWQQVFSSEENITITLPDNTTYQGPSWGKIAAGVNFGDLDKISPIANQIAADVAAFANTKTEITEAVETGKTDIADMVAGVEATIKDAVTAATGEATTAADKAEAAQSAAEAAAKDAAKDAAEAAQSALDDATEEAVENIKTASAELVDEVKDAADAAKTSQTAAEAAQKEAVEAAAKLVDLKTLQVEATTVESPADAAATFDLENNKLLLDIPRGEKGEKGEVEGLDESPFVGPQAAGSLLYVGANGGVYRAKMTALGEVMPQGIYFRGTINGETGEVKDHLKLLKEWDGKRPPIGVNVTADGTMFIVEGEGALKLNASDTVNVKDGDELFWSETDKTWRHRGNGSGGGLDGFTSEATDTTQTLHSTNGGHLGFGPSQIGLMLPDNAAGLSVAADGKVYVYQDNTPHEVYTELNPPADSLGAIAALVNGQVTTIVAHQGGNIKLGETCSLNTVKGGSLSVAGDGTLTVAVGDKAYPVYSELNPPPVNSISGFTFTGGATGGTISTTGGGAITIGAVCELTTSAVNGLAQLQLDGAGGLTVYQSGIPYKVYTEKNPPAGGDGGAITDAGGTIHGPIIVEGTVKNANNVDIAVTTTINPDSIVFGSDDLNTLRIDRDKIVITESDGDKRFQITNTADVSQLQHLGNTIDTIALGSGIRLTAGGGAVYNLTADGNAFIKANNQTYYLYSDLRKPPVAALSDRRSKRNISKIDDALSKLDALTGSLFEVEHNGTWEQGGGLIAQDVQKVLPELVSVDENDASGEERLRLNYNGVVGLLVEAVKELRAEVRALAGE